MKKVKLSCTSANYNIHIGQGLVAKAGATLKTLKAGKKVFIVSNKKVAGYFLKPLVASLKKSGFEVTTYLLPYGTERDKTKEVLFKLWEKMASVPLDRSSAVVALGGGVVGDLAGFAAATYMRGIKVVQVPTTLLAQVDSAIGGKTAIDLESAKNIVGAFHQPACVLTDTRTLETLPKTPVGKSALRSSFAEVVKYGVIHDVKLFELLEKEEATLVKCFKKGTWSAKQRKLIEEVITRSSKAKAYVVSEDEFETKGLRMTLNFGHTFAHGFESASNYKLSHGDAVSVGMVCAARLGVLLGLLSQKAEERLVSLLWAYDLPIDLDGLDLDTEKVMHAMQRDKKRTSSGLKFVVPSKIGKVVLRENIPPATIRKIIRGAGTL